MRSARVWDGEHAGTAIKTHLADRTVHAGNELLSSGGQICLSCLFIVFLFFFFFGTPPPIRHEVVKESDCFDCQKNEEQQPIVVLN